MGTDLVRYASPSGLTAELNANGSVRRLLHGDIVLNLFPGTAAEGGPLNLYVRRLTTPIAWSPLLGPRSPLAVHVAEDGLVARGTWGEVHVEVALVLASTTPAWFWHVTLENRSREDVTLDLVYAHDVGLAHWGAIRMNEYYVSQYLDHAPLDHARHGTLLASRQNLSMGGHQPWQVVGSLDRAVAWATDALQLHGLATRAGEAPAALVASRLPAERRQHEHAMAVLQDAAVRLGPGERMQRGFFGWFSPDHPAATSSADAAVAERALALPEAVPPASTSRIGTPVGGSLFADAPLLACRDLGEDEVGRRWRDERRHVERDDAGRLLSFFTGSGDHVVLRAKELSVLRPHGQLLRTGTHLVPDEASLTTTVYMAGVFGALVTQGHVSINRFLSTTRSYLSLQRAQGQRVFVELDGRWHLLDVPSAWDASGASCRWTYVHDRGRIAVAVAAASERHEIDLTITVEEGAPARFLLSHHVALGADDGFAPATVDWRRDGEGIVVRAPADSDVGRRFPNGTFRLTPAPGTTIERIGGDELLHADGRSRSEPFLVLATAPATSVGLRITADLVPPTDPTIRERDPLGPFALAGDAPAVSRIAEIVPWFVRDALVHYLAPRGLEQYSGGGWGTRDVCQGPVELLLALGHHAPLRDLLLRVFANQNADGDWPQWFMFFDRERNIRPAEAHGDIVFWPLLALGQYLQATDDGTLLDEPVAFFHPDGAGEGATVWAHVERALGVVATRVVPGTRLPAYGHGDWNDSLQPVDPSMRERLCSAWTATLEHQTLTVLADGLRRVGRARDAAPLDEAAAALRDEFQRHLLADGVLAGFLHVHADGRFEHLLHPRDAVTGIHYRLLPMIHAVIAELLTPAQAATHVQLIRSHLLGADGARLFDHPPAYRGGPQVRFQRAESSTFFGREIGLMYTHAHLRWAEALARLGEADALFDALQHAHPIALGSVVPTARPRQANCYYSSSDAVVADRYDAAARYADVRAGRVPYEGGWRVYSSGAGIAVRLIHECFLGLRRGRERLGVDPVIPAALDGMRATVSIAGHPVTVTYRVGPLGHGPTRLVLNGTSLPFERMPNPYRTGGVTVAMADVRAALAADDDVLAIQLG